MLLSELLEGLFSIDVFIPEGLVLAGVAMCRLELPAAIQTLVACQSATLTIFLCEMTDAIRAYFRPFLIRILNILKFS